MPMQHSGAGEAGALSEAVWNAAYARAPSLMARATCPSSKQLAASLGASSDAASSSSAALVSVRTCSASSIDGRTTCWGPPADSAGRSASAPAAGPLPPSGALLFHPHTSVDTPIASAPMADATAAGVLEYSNQPSRWSSAGDGACGGSSATSALTARMRPGKSPSISYTLATCVHASAVTSGRMPSSTPPRPMAGGDVAAARNAASASCTLPALKCSRPSAKCTSPAHSYVGWWFSTELNASAASSGDPCTSYMTPTPCHRAGSCSFSGVHAMAVWNAVKASPTKFASVVAVPSDAHASA